MAISFLDAVQSDEKYMDSVSGELGGQVEREENKDDVAPCVDNDPLVDHALDHLVNVFYEMKHAYEMRGLMANSTPGGLVELIKRSVRIEEVEEEYSSSEQWTDDELEPELLMGY